jgi:di/tricarboxylate transporter
MQDQGLTPQILLTLGITFSALALFIWNRMRVDVVALIVMASLIVLGLVTPQQGTSGFANEATITVALMLVLAAGLVRTGAVDILAHWVARLAGDSEIRLTAIVLLFTIPASALINNTPVVLVMLPVVVGVARQKGMAPSRLLMPLSFGSQLGGTLTLIGTSTNLLVAGLVLELGLDRIGLFDITPPAFVLMLIGVAYILTVGRWLVPARTASTDLAATYELREYLSALEVQPTSSLAGKTLAATRFGQRFGLQVVAIERDDERLPFPAGGARVEAGDLLIVSGRVPDIARIGAEAGLKISGSKSDILVDPQTGQVTEGGLGEVLVPPRSRAEGRTIRDLGFRARYGLNVLALKRHGEARHEPIGALALEAGDILLVQGTPDAMHELHRRGDFTLLGALDLPVRRAHKVRIAIVILAGVVLLAALDITTIMVSALLGTIAMLITGCIRANEAYRDVDWMVIVLLGAIIPLGIAMQNTGTAQYVAVMLLAVTEPLGLYGTLAGFYLLTSLLTEVISNNAAAVVLTPIAVAAATALGVSPLPFVVAIMIAASNSFMTPIGYQTNTFIYGPGGYQFSDFLRVGGPLNVLLAVAGTFVIPLFFPF